MIHAWVYIAKYLTWGKIASTLCIGLGQGIPHAQDLHGLVWGVHHMSPEYGSATSKRIVFRSHWVF